MTTVIYSAGILAADKRSTTPGRESDKRICNYCGTKPTLVSNDTAKINIDFKCIMFRGEQILAIAGSGKRFSIDKNLKLIRAGENIEEVIRIATLLNQDYAGNHLGCVLLIITTVKGYKLTIGIKDEPAVAIESFELSDTIAIGSGGKVALFAVKVLKLSPTDAIKASMTVDEGTGGGIDYISLLDPNFNGVIIYESITDVPAAIKAIENSLCRKYTPVPVIKPRTTNKLSNN